MVSAKEYKPPTDLWKARNMGNLDPFRALGPDDPRNVETHPGREEFDEKEFYNRLGVDMESNIPILKTDASSPGQIDSGGGADAATGYDRLNILFCGHRGSGKSTELRRLASNLKGPGVFETVYLDVASELGPHNPQFNDIIFMLTLKLFEQLDKMPEVTKEINKVAFQALEDWFTTVVVENIKKKGASAEVSATAGAGFNYFGFLKLWSGIKTAFKIESIEKETVRAEMANYFSAFARHFNTFLISVRNALQKSGRAKDVLFIVDGTDKFTTPDKARAFFIDSSDSFYALDARFIYTAPVNMAYDPIVKNHFKIIRLPMVTVVSRDGSVSDTGMKIMRELITKRLDSSVFENEDLIKSFACCSGGCPRQAVHLLSEAVISKSDGETGITRAAFEKAVKKLGVEFKGSLIKPHYELLGKYIAEPEYTPISEDEDKLLKDLLFSLALLEYNTYWRAPNPVVKELDEFRRITGITGS